MPGRTDQSDRASNQELPSSQNPQHAALLAGLLKTWSIGIYTGDSPFHFFPAAVENPVLTQSDVSDIPASFVADPFMIRAASTWYMFFEAKNAATRKGEIGLAMSADGFDWHYEQIVLAEPFHLSYPYVFESEGEYYMIPETLEAKQIRLYKATCFPYGWTHLTDLVPGTFADSSILRAAGKWWIFTCSHPFKHNELRLFFAERLAGPWREHPRSPLIENNPHIARPAGRVIAWNNSLIRFAQDCYPHYGTQVRAFAITELTPESYHERECEGSPILVPGDGGWNKQGMHHIDAHLNSDGKWIACVDGNARVLSFTKSVS